MQSCTEIGHSIGLITFTQRPSEFQNTILVFFHHSYRNLVSLRTEQVTTAKQHARIAFQLMPRHAVIHRITREQVQYSLPHSVRTGGISMQSLVSFLSHHTGFTSCQSQHGRSRLRSRSAGLVIFKVIDVGIATVYFNAVYQHVRSCRRKFQFHFVCPGIQFRLYGRFGPSITRRTQIQELPFAVHVHLQAQAAARQQVTDSDGIGSLPQHSHGITNGGRTACSHLHVSLTLVTRTAVIITVSTACPDILVVKKLSFILQSPGVNGRNLRYFYPSLRPLRLAVGGFTFAFNRDFHRPVVSHHQGQHPILPYLFYFAGPMGCTVEPSHHRFFHDTVDAHRVFNVFSFCQVVVIGQTIIAHIKHHAVRIFLHYSHGIRRKVQRNTVRRII